MTWISGNECRSGLKSNTRKKDFFPSIWLENKIFFSEYLTWDHFYTHFHFIQVTISLIMYSHLSFGHISTLQSGRTCVTHKNPVHDLAHHQSPIAQWLERSNRYSGRSWVRLPLGNSGNLFPSIWVESTSSFIFTLSRVNLSLLTLLYPSHNFTYHL